MKRLFLLLALVGMIATSCEDSGIEEPSNPTEQPDDNTDEEQPGGDDNTDEEQPGDDENDDDELPVFEIDGPGKYTIGAEGGSIDVVVTTNLEYRLEVSEDAQSWLTIADTRAVRTERLTISVSPNNTDSERTATISVFDGADNKVFSFTLTQEYVNLDEIIKFVDNTVKAICLLNWDTNGDAELSIGEAVAVTDIGTKFQSKDIMAFDEFKYFTGVTTIVTGAFEDCANLVKISIPDSVTTIGESAFEDCDSLTSVNIPDSVTTIGYDAFAYCESLTSVYCKATTPPALGGTYVFYDNGSGRKFYVPTESVVAYKRAYGWSEYAHAIVGYDFEKDEIVEVHPNTEIWYTSSDCKIVRPYDTNVFGAIITSNIYNEGKGIITFDGNVTTIGNYAFCGCYRLTSVNIPDSVTTIGNMAFEDCTSLTSVNIPDSVTSIGEQAFHNCDGLTEFNIPDSVTTIGDYTFCGCDSLTSVTIGDGVTTISSSAFSSCKSLTEFNGKFASEDGRCLIIDGVLTSFAPYGLTEYTIPDSVTTIGRYAFSGCDSLTSVTIGDSVTTIGEGAFYSCDSLTSVNIPDSVTMIGEDAFGSCDSLTSITIPDSVTKIGEGAFSWCDSLTSVTIPDSVTKIGDEAFRDCDSLTSVTIPDSVTTIGECAFYDCDSLTSITIPNSVIPIGDKAFCNCDSLTSVYCKATTPPLLAGTYVFYGNHSDRKIYVPTESVDAYKSNWSAYASAIVGYDFENGVVVE